MKMKTSNTAERLNQIMSERNLRQVDVLNMTKRYCEMYNIKMNKSDISQYCSGKVEPNQNKLFVLSAALKVNISWLMGFDAPQEPQIRISDALNERDPHIYNALVEGLRSFNWEIKFNQIDGEMINYTLSNDICSISVSKEFITNIEKDLKQFLINELKDVFFKQNDILFQQLKDDSVSSKNTFVEFSTIQQMDEELSAACDTGATPEQKDNADNVMMDDGEWK